MKLIYHTLHQPCSCGSTIVFIHLTWWGLRKHIWCAKCGTDGYLVDFDKLRVVKGGKGESTD